MESRSSSNYTIPVQPILLKELENKLNKLSVEGRRHIDCQQKSDNLLPYQDYDFINRDLLAKLEESSPAKSYISNAINNLSRSKKISLENENLLGAATPSESNNESSPNDKNDKLCTNLNNENDNCYTTDDNNQMLQYYSNFSNFSKSKNVVNANIVKQNKINTQINNMNNQNSSSRVFNFEHHSLHNQNNLNGNINFMDNSYFTLNKSNDCNKTGGFGSINLSMYNNTSFNHIFSGKTGWFCILCRNFNFESKFVIIKIGRIKCNRCGKNKLEIEDLVSFKTQIDETNENVIKNEKIRTCNYNEPINENQNKSPNNNSMNENNNNLNTNKKGKNYLFH